MIKEDYVSFETAKLLKEKGFDEPTTKSYYTEGFETPMIFSHDLLPRIRTDEFLCPTLQMAMKWLRQQGIYITIVYGDYPALKKIVWTPQIDSLTGFDIPDEFYQDYPTYEEACEAAIKYSLENLI